MQYALAFMIDDTEQYIAPNTVGLPLKQLESYKETLNQWSTKPYYIIEVEA